MSAVAPVDHAFWSGRLTALVQALLGDIDVPREVAERHAREALAEFQAERDRFIDSLSSDRRVA